MKLAVYENKLDPNDLEGIKNFRKNVKICKLADIESSSASNEEEGRMAAETKRIDALRRGSEHRKNLYHRIQEELLGISCIAPLRPNSPCPNTSTPLRSVSRLNLPCGQEPYQLPKLLVTTDSAKRWSFREWLKNPATSHIHRKKYQRCLLSR